MQPDGYIDISRTIFSISVQPEMRLVLGLIDIEDVTCAYRLRRLNCPLPWKLQVAILTTGQPHRFISVESSVVTGENSCHWLGALLFHIPDHHRIIVSFRRPLNSRQFSVLVILEMVFLFPGTIPYTVLAIMMRSWSSARLAQQSRNIALRVSYTRLAHKILPFQYATQKDDLTLRV